MLNADLQEVPHHEVEMRLVSVDLGITGMSLKRQAGSLRKQLYMLLRSTASILVSQLGYSVHRQVLPLSGPQFPQLQQSSWANSNFLLPEIRTKNTGWEFILGVFGGGLPREVIFEQRPGWTQSGEINR